MRYVISVFGLVALLSASAPAGAFDAGGVLSTAATAAVATYGASTAVSAADGDDD